jgi:putative transposase
MVRELRARGFSASKTRVELLMRDIGFNALHKRRHKITTNSKHDQPAAENLIARNFTPTAQN